MSYTLDVSTKGNPEQAELARLIHEKHRPIIYCEGDAGTGKTFIALAAAFQLVFDKKYKNIIYMRAPVEVGSISLGYLPGELDQKFEPFLAPLHDNINNLAKICKRNPNELLQKVNPQVPQFIRGASYPNDTIIIADEAQNFSMIEIKTLLTRLADYTKVVLLGSTNQIDRKGMTKEHNAFMDSYHKLEDLPFVGYVKLEQSMRSEFTKIIDERLQI